MRINSYDMYIRVVDVIVDEAYMTRIIVRVVFQPWNIVIRWLFFFRSIHRNGKVYMISYWSYTVRIS